MDILTPEIYAGLTGVATTIVINQKMTPRHWAYATMMGVSGALFLSPFLAEFLQYATTFEIKDIESTRLGIAWILGMMGYHVGKNIQKVFDIFIEGLRKRLLGGRHD